jgi:hypothetical protein
VAKLMPYLLSSRTTSTTWTAGDTRGPKRTAFIPEDSEFDGAGHTFGGNERITISGTRASLNARKQDALHDEQSTSNASTTPPTRRSLLRNGEQTPKDLPLLSPIASQIAAYKCKMADSAALTFQSLSVSSTKAARRNSTHQLEGDANPSNSRNWNRDLSNFQVHFATKHASPSSMRPCEAFLSGSRYLIMDSARNNNAAHSKSLTTAKEKSQLG